MEYKRIIDTKDYLGNDSTFSIIWETVFMSCTFAVGIDFNDPDEMSIFYVYHMFEKDHYECLDTLFINVYEKYGYSYIEKIKKEMAKKTKEVLIARLKAGLITLDKIEKWAKYGA